MSDHLPDPESPRGGATDDGHTEEYPTVDRHARDVRSTDRAWLAGDDSGDATRSGSARRRTGSASGCPLAALVALLLVAGGFWGGAALEKSHAAAARAALRAWRPASDRRGRQAPERQGASASIAALPACSPAPPRRATGTISVVDGNTLYVDAPRRGRSSR